MLPYEMCCKTLLGIKMHDFKIYKEIKIEDMFLNLNLKIQSLNSDNWSSTKICVSEV